MIDLLVFPDAARTTINADAWRQMISRVTEEGETALVLLCQVVQFGDAESGIAGRIGEEIGVLPLMQIIGADDPVVGFAAAEKIELL